MIICKVLFKYCGDNINLGNNAYFGYGSNISVGDNSQIGPYCELYGAIKIGDDVMMGTHVIILTVDHEYTDTNTPMRLQGVQEMKPVTIEDDVWIGTRCIILPGVAIGKGSIIGAGSTVTTNVLPFSIVGGNPARLIRMRK